MTGGFLGELFASLSFAGALIAAISFFLAEKRKDGDAIAWQGIGKAAFWAHLAGVLGVIGTLFYLIYSHQYQYHYVWNHSSNELPVHFMISCFWEGQEGSFLLWTFWHAILGMVVMFTAGKWRNIVLAVLSSVNLVLASMILGVYVGETGVKILFSLAVLIPSLFIGWKLWKQKEGKSLMARGYLHLYAFVVGLLTVVVFLTGNGGFWAIEQISELGLSLSTLGLLFYYLLVFALFFVLVAVIAIEFVKKDKTQRLPTQEILAISVVWILAFLTCKFQPESWKIGSTPFILLKDAVSAPIFASNPDFVPTNGTGLNPLLQNYWMVIHPPTLFLGFASTALPFSFLIGGLIKGKFSEWIRPAMPWMIFSSAVLGIGIIMGGYWAYETLNFGGYWNWDPVENSSFVPWLISVASIHGLLAYRKSKTFLKFSMLLVIATFLLVLYSTFLTRSGILGETSVHTFTDLGLSGQLILLLMFYAVGVLVLMISRWKQIPEVHKDIPVASAEFLLFLGSLCLIFMSLVVIIATSLPVFGAIFDTHFSSVKDSNFFYYRWTVWFAIGMSFLSGVGQFMFWRKSGKKHVTDIMARPFIVAAIAAIAVMLYIAFSGGDFGFDHRFKTALEDASLYSGVDKFSTYVGWFFFVFADEILLFASFFTVFANLDVLIYLFRKNRKTQRVTGGSVAHIGFALMILGILFSSGYEKTISKNLSPQELPLFAEDERVDNVVLEKNRPRLIKGYQVTYIGKKKAEPPVSNLEVIEEGDRAFKIRFDDKDGEKYGLTMPKDVFVNENQELDLALVTEFLDEKVEVLKPKMINERSLFGVEFIPVHADEQRRAVLEPEKRFVLYPEAEVNPNMGLIAHPSRKIFAGKDIYVHVSSIPKEEEETPEFKPYNFAIGIGDTIQTGRARIYLSKVSSDDTTGTPYDLIARAHLKVFSVKGENFEAEPLYQIDRQNRVSVKDAWVEGIHSYILFTGVNTATGKMQLQIQEQVNPPEDYIVLKAIQKPAINILWLGTFLLTIGFGMAIYRRIREARGSSEK